MLELWPIDYLDACMYIDKRHRHLKAPAGHKFSISARDGNSIDPHTDQPEIAGVIMVGRPVNRMLDDGFTLEVNRLATNGKKNACSFLYGAAWRSAKAQGYRRLITYILLSETGASLRAAGWNMVAEVRKRSWDTPSRRREEKHEAQQRLRFEISDWSASTLTNVIKNPK